MATFHYRKAVLKAKGPDGKTVERPYAKIDLAGAADADALIAALVEVSGLSKGNAQAAVTNLGEALARLIKQERSVKVPGMGIFTPTLDTPKGDPLNVDKSTIKLNFRLDGGLERAVNSDLHVVERS